MWDRDGQPIPLWRAVYDFQNQGCSDPRDKIWGLLGIIDATGIVPDYRNMSTARLFEDVLRFGLSKMREAFSVGESKMLPAIATWRLRENFEFERQRKTFVRDLRSILSVDHQLVEEIVARVSKEMGE